MQVTMGVSIVMGIPQELDGLFHEKSQVDDLGVSLF